MNPHHQSGYAPAVSAIRLGLFIYFELWTDTYIIASRVTDRSAVYHVTVDEFEEVDGG